MKRLLYVFLIFLSFSLFAQNTQSTGDDSIGSSTVQTTESKADFFNPYKLVLTSGNGLERQEKLTDKTRLLLAATVDEYRVSPGDVYSLSYVLAGGVSSQINFMVTTDFKAVVGILGQIDFKGLTYRLLRQKVIELANKAYPGSNPVVTIVSTGLFPVSRIGAVKSSLPYYAWGLSRLSDLWEDSRTEYTSLRNITIKSSDGSSKSYDLFSALSDGLAENNPLILPGDHIIFSSVSTLVDIEGKINRPGRYEVLAEDTLRSLVERYSRGALPSANMKNIEVFRFDENGYTSFLVSNDQFDSFRLKHLDKVMVGGIDSGIPRVWLEGAISGSGVASRISLPYVTGQSLRSLITRNIASIRSDADFSRIYVNRKGEYYPINFVKDASGEGAVDDFILEDGDIIGIPYYALYVRVRGGVSQIGDYPYEPGRNAEYYIGLAGGFDTRYNYFQDYSIIMKNGEKAPKNHLLQPEDTIMVHSYGYLYWVQHLTLLLSSSITLVGLIMTAIGYFK